jgi:predicted transposase YbfD/YdcC
VLKLLGFLSLRGSIVTSDARNCQRDIAQKIVENEGDYVWRSKEITAPCI